MQFATFIFVLQPHLRQVGAHEAQVGGGLMKGHVEGPVVMVSLLQLPLHLLDPVSSFPLLLPQPRVHLEGSIKVDHLLFITKGLCIVRVCMV